jgi:FkbM family methyltransferase
MSITFNEVDSQLAGYYEIIIDRIYDRSEAVIAKPGWTVVDVGANIGMFTIWEARRGARVIAYEPHPRAFTNLLTNLDANGVGQLVTCHQLAIASSAGTAWLAADAGATAAQLTADRSRQGFEVETVTLDESLAAYGLDHIDLLKVDVEGAELNVIAGAGATLDKTKAAIIEVHDGIRPEEVDAQLARHGLIRDPAGRFPNLYYARTLPINRTA